MGRVKQLCFMHAAICEVGVFTYKQPLLPAPYRVFITNLNVGNEHSIFCFHFLSRFTPTLFYYTLFSKCVTHYDTFPLCKDVSRFIFKIKIDTT